MIHNRKKVAKIVEELSMFFFSIGGVEQSSSIKLHEDYAEIKFESVYDLKFEHKLDSMERLLNSEHDSAMEDVYWALAGSGDPGESSQLLLIGMMVDTAVIQRLEGRVKIEMTKRFA